MRCSTLVMEIAIVFLAPFLWVALSEMAKPAETEPVLSDYPELFGKDVMIMIGNNENGIEIERADAIVGDLFNRTGNMPVVKTAADSPTANSGRGMMNARRSTRGSWCGMAILIAFAAMLAVCTLPASALTCEYDMCVNETGWWNASGAFNASGMPIQAAIDNATAGDTIYLYNGSYTENVDVNKQLTLQGESAGVVDVTNSTADNHVFNVTADYVNISGFNVTGATGSANAGIYLGGRQHCNISNNAASNNNNGIYLYSSSNNTLANNTANSNRDQGIYLYNSSNNTLANNTASNNIWQGICLSDSSNFNTLTNNTANSNTRFGILLLSSSNNMLTNNTANSNNKNGIYLYDSSSSNTLANNTANSNTNYGIRLYGTNNFNTLTSNTASNNDYGIHLYSSSSNTIYNNYFNNTNNAYDNGNNIWNTTPTTGTNIIGGSNLGGNYWSDYAGADTNGDGLGDTLTPYSSSGGIQNGGDLHPLTASAAPPENYVPGDPTNLQNTVGNYWVNYTWSAGTGNATNSYNVSMNGAWTNGTANTFANTSVGPSGWANITVFAYNASGTGTLSAGSVSDEVQAPAAPEQNYVPGDPTNLQNTVGNYWVNYTWSPGAGNVTDSFNVCMNGTWNNGTTDTFVNTSVGPSGWANITVFAYNASGTGTLSEESVSDEVQAPAAPASVSNLGETDTGTTWILWGWTNPSDSDFSHTKVYIDGVFKADVNAPGNSYNAAGLSPDTTYEIGTRTVDDYDNMNPEWVNDTATTLRIYNITFLPPITTPDHFNLKNGRTLPIKFTARDNDTGEFIYDDTVNVTITNSTGHLIAFFTNGTGTDSVRINSIKEQYIVNFHTKNYDLNVGDTYTIHVTFGEADTLRGYALTHFTLVDRKH